METVVLNGSVNTDEINQGKEYNDVDKSFINGKVESVKNGHTILSSQDEVLNNKKWAGIPPPMDWSQYDTFPGSFEKSTLLTAVLTHLGLYFLMLLGFVNQLRQALFGVKNKMAKEKNREGYAPLFTPFERFYWEFVYRRVRHCFNIPICSAPGARVTLLERTTDDHNWTFRLTGRKQECLNMGSYNYFGLAEGSGVTAPAVRETARALGLAACSPRAELGSTAAHADLEAALASFLGVEAAVVFGMGFATNALVLPGLLGPGVLALSDENNHASLILGLRLARATVRVFRHNDVRHVEQLARRALAERRWRKIVVVVEGVYSMEGSIAPLAALVALKRRLGLALYLDEAHSAGALGPGARGATEHCGVPARHVDVLMGTFTKAFGAAGGYVAGAARVVAHVRAHSHAHTYAHALAPPVARQVAAALALIDSPEGRRRARALADNALYFRRRLREMGLVTFGSEQSPVVPMLVYSFSKMAGTVERLRARGVAVVGVGFPATPLNKARIRFCLSAAHTREQLDECLRAVDEVADELGLRYARRHHHHHRPHHPTTHPQ